MSALPKDIEGRANGPDRAALCRNNGAALMCAKLAPYRAAATDLGFTLLMRDCSDASQGSRRCVDTFVHPSGIWLDLVGNLDAALSFGPILAKFRSWTIDDAELVEVATVAATPLWRTRALQKAVALLERLFDPEVRTHPLRSASDLEAELARHQSILRRDGLTPLIAAGDPMNQRSRWQQIVRSRLQLVAPP